MKINGQNLPVLPPALVPQEPAFPAGDYEIEKRPKQERQMQALRLAVALQKLHDICHNSGVPEADGVEAAQALAITCLNHFDEIVWALRVAGGARKP